MSVKRRNRLGPWSTLPRHAPRCYRRRGAVSNSHKAHLTAHLCRLYGSLRRPSQAMCVCTFSTFSCIGPMGYVCVYNLNFNPISKFGRQYRKVSQRCRTSPSSDHARLLATTRERGLRAYGFLFSFAMEVTTVLLSVATTNRNRLRVCCGAHSRAWQVYTCLLS